MWLSASCRVCKIVKFIEVLKLLAAIAISELAGLVGGYFSASSVNTWYRTLNKPAFNPPSWAFGPVWIILYVFMGVAAYSVWRKGLGNRDVQISLAVFLVQLVLNALWSFAFFGLRSPFAGFVVIILLIIAILITIYLFSRVSSIGALLMVPYLFWVVFATVLNGSIWLLNQ